MYTEYKHLSVYPREAEDIRQFRDHLSPSFWEGNSVLLAGCCRSWGCSKIAVKLNLEYQDDWDNNNYRWWSGKRVWPPLRKKLSLPVTNCRADLHYRKQQIWTIDSANLDRKTFKVSGPIFFFKGNWIRHFSTIGTQNIILLRSEKHGWYLVQ